MFPINPWLSSNLFQFLSNWTCAGNPPMSFGSFCPYSCLRMRQLSWNSQSPYFLLSKGGNILLTNDPQQRQQKTSSMGLPIAIPGFFCHFNWIKSSFRFNLINVGQKLSPTLAAFILYQWWKFKLTKNNLCSTSINTLWMQRPFKESNPSLRNITNKASLFLARSLLILLSSPLNGTLISRSPKSC